MKWSMCESKLYVLERGERKQVLDNAVLVREQDGRVVARGLLGETVELEGGRIVEVDAEGHAIVVRVEE